MSVVPKVKVPPKEAHNFENSNNVNNSKELRIFYCLCGLAGSSAREFSSAEGCMHRLIAPAGGRSFRDRLRVSSACSKKKNVESLE